MEPREPGEAVILMFPVRKGRASRLAEWWPVAVAAIALAGLLAVAARPGHAGAAVAADAPFFLPD